MSLASERKGLAVRNSRCHVAPDGNRRIRIHFTKSKLTKAELSKAFENIASYKKLRKVNTRHARSERGFGIIFAYDSDLEWTQLVDGIESLAPQYSREVLPNLIVVLKKGYFLFGDTSSRKLGNAEIESIQDLLLFGNPDRQGNCLYSFYTALMTLLRDGEAPPVLAMHGRNFVMVDESAVAVKIMEQRWKPYSPRREAALPSEEPEI
jgi:hypothetical protein